MLALGVQRIGGDHRPGQVQRRQQRRETGDLVGLAVHFGLGKHGVYQLAAEFGVQSKVIMAKLQEMGEFTRSASSTVEHLAAYKLRQQFAAREHDGRIKPAVADADPSPVQVLNPAPPG